MTCMHIHMHIHTPTSTLQAIDLKHLPPTCSDRVLQLMSAACRSACDVRLDFGYFEPGHEPGYLDLAQFYTKLSDKYPLVHLSEALSHNSALISLQLTFTSDPISVFNLDCMFESCTGLQSLTIASSFNAFAGDCSDLPARAIAKLCCIARLCPGPGLHLKDLPQILAHLTGLQELRLQGHCKLDQLECLTLLTALRTLELHCFSHIKELPSLAALTALTTLDLTGCEYLLQLPPLDTLTALQTLILGFSQKLQHLPPLDKFTALWTLKCGSLHPQ
jgi:hypothetical protein